MFKIQSRRETTRKEVVEEQRSRSREKKKKVRFKLYRIQQETNELLSKINRGRGPGLEKFGRYQAGPFFPIKMLLIHKYEM